MKKKSNSSTILSVALLIAAIVLLVVTGHLNILLAIFMIGVVICFHEFGHFLIARLNGVTVKEFSLGLGPRLLSWKMLGTRWSLKLLPFGGSCLMLDDGELAAFEEEETDGKILFLSSSMSSHLAISSFINMVSYSLSESGI